MFKAFNLCMLCCKKYSKQRLRKKTQIKETLCSGILKLCDSDC